MQHVPGNAGMHLSERSDASLERSVVEGGKGRLRFEKDQFLVVTSHSKKKSRKHACLQRKGANTRYDPKIPGTPARPEQTQFF